MMTDEQIAKYEAKDFKRWTKDSMDRLYINVTDLGLVADYYKSGNVCGGEWQGEGVGSSATKRLLASKVYVDVKTGELHVTSNFDEYGMPSVEEIARKVVEDIEKGEDEPEEDATDEHPSDAMSAAQRPQSARNKADAAYRKANVTRFEVKLYPADSDIAQHLEDIDEPRATYIKRLIREDMARRA